MFAATRVATWVLIVTSVCFAPALAQEVTDPFGEPPSSAAKPQAVGDAATPVFYAEEHSQHVNKIRKVLREPLREGGLEFQDTALSEVVDFLRSEYGIEIQLDLESLKQIERSPEDPISANLRNISVGSALRLMLRQLNLTYFISDEVLMICAEEEALTRLVVAVYPVGDILAIKEGHESVVDENGDKNNKPGVEDIDGLIDVIISTVASDSWVENGGPEAEIRSIQPGLLVVSQTPDVHEQIRHLLAALRQAKKHEYAVPHRPGKWPTGFCGGHTPQTEPTPAEGQAPRDATSPRQDQGGGGMF
jgi:hypothetical protein